MAEMRTALGMPITHQTKTSKNPIIQWILDVWEGFYTVLVGMGVTWRHFFRKPFTVQYPHEKLNIPKQARQRVHVDIDLCGGCLQCDKICPAGIIKIVTAKPVAGEDLGVRPNGKRRALHIAEFTIDHSKCLYCGLCETVCNDDAIYMIPDFQYTTRSLEQLVVNYSRYSPEERDRVVAAAAAEKAAKQASKPAVPQTKVSDPQPNIPSPSVDSDVFNEKCPGPDGEFK
ncbi:MAG: 4Fe-4S dicluster domain-containing protein [bacterium]|nr:4Fe-4S dicluster domain-containing protein [bacterium]